MRLHLVLVAASALALAGCSTPVAPSGPNCTTPLVDCSGACVNTKADAFNCGGCGKACAAGESCVDGACAIACPAGQTVCDGACVNTKLDPDHCGDCTTVCSGGQVCARGACTFSCPAGQIACNAACVNVLNDPDNCGDCDQACPNGQSCAKGDCVLECPAGMTACGSSCVATRYDPDNCGKCGKACASGEVCASGACALVCPVGQTACNGACVSTKNDPENCGQCGTRCLAGEVCSASICTSNCATGLDPCSGACVDLKTDPQHCGVCTTACDPSEICSNSACLPVCPVGQTACDGACVNTQYDPANCGQCGNQCGSGLVCIASACQPFCSVGQIACGGVCTGTAYDPKNCGKCGTECAAGEVCSGGTCSANCGGTLTPCGGACVDLVTNAQHCGTCEKACAASEGCIASECVPVCPAGQTACSGACVNTKTDPAHCGSCGTTCGAGELCQAGVCKPFCQAGLTACDGACVNLQSDPANCGLCAKVCAGNEVCSAGVCKSSCATGQAYCGGACVTLATDPKNCGQCGTVCATNQVCLSGACKTTACTTNLYQPIVDSWGETWDGTERGLTSYDQAKAACEALGGRLPTATELYRVGAPMSGGVGTTYHTNYLWALNHYDATNQIIVRLSDNSVTTSPIAVANKRPYRCLCPDATPTTFDQNACFGPVGSSCGQLVTEGKRYNIDNYDRAPLPKGAAMWECAFYRGHLADSIQLVEAITNGLPNGSTAWLHTADDARYNYDIIVKWSGVQPGWAADTSNITVSDLTTNRNFRCVGVNYAAAPFPTTIANEFVGPTSLYKSEKADNASASWPVAQDTCWNRGGHLPRSTEMGELIQQGMPGGTNAWLWTSDQEGWNATQFLAGIIRWTGVDTRFGHYHSTYNSWAYKTDPGYPYRCIYYPIDADYAGPSDATQCNGGCQKFSVGGGLATMWFDKSDRTPTTWGSAANICMKAGGHLASERDYTEAIRHGLGSGSGTAVWLHTSDLEWGEYGLNNGIIHWTGTGDTTFTDQYSTWSTWGALTTASPYRCVWTNELR